MAPLENTSTKCSSVAPGGGSSTGLTQCAEIISCQKAISSTGPISGSQRLSR